MKTSSRVSFGLAPAGRQGFMLIDCLVYIALLALILGLAFVAFYRTLEHSTRLNANAADIARALHVGEQWRDDVRTANRPLQVSRDAGQSTVSIGQANGEILYVFKDGAVFREARPGNGQSEVLTGVKHCEFLLDQRQRVTGWRWELELLGKQDTTRIRPLFTFLAVPDGNAKP